MRLGEFIERTRMVNVDAFPADRYQGLVEELEKQPALSALEGEWLEAIKEVPVEHLRRLSEACRAWREREDAVQQAIQEAREAGREVPPDQAVNLALVPHKVHAVFRAVTLCASSAYPDEEAWVGALSAYINAWSGAVNLALKRGELRCHVDLNHPEAKRFADYARRSENLSDLPGHRWLAIRRGERLGVIQVDFRWPVANIKALVESFRQRLGGPCTEMDPEELADKLAFDHLESAVRSILDRRVEDEAIRSAVTLYSELLESPPLCRPPVGSVSVGAEGAPLGVAVVGDEGQVLDWAVVKEENWKEGLLEALAGHGLENVVVPNTAPDKARLIAVRNLLAGEYGVLTVRSAALADARKRIEEEIPGIGRQAASAVVLARRAIDPATEWSKVNPVHLGLAEYQNDLDVSRLERALRDALALHQRAGTPKFRHQAQARPTVQPRTLRGKLNPLVSSIRELKPGMAVRGIVANITNFGAFVDLGLEEQAFCHVSELSKQFVKSPHDVVSLGQEVTGWILEVDPSGTRVAITLKGPPSPRPRSKRKPGPRDKAETLARLESLFKK